MNRRWLTLAALLLSVPALAEESSVPTERVRRAIRYALSQTPGPLTNGASIRVRTDENGYLLIRDPGSGGGQTPGPLTPFANLRVRTDENGYLLVRDLLGGSGSGSVTSVGLSLPSIFTVSGSPVTTSGTLTGALATQTAATFFAGPATGSAAAPTFRAIAATDVPTLNQNTTGSAASFTGSLVGDVTGTQGATVVGNDSHDHTGSTVSGLAVADFTSANISAWTNDSGYQTTAGTVTNFSGSLVGDVTGTQGATVVGDNSHAHDSSTVTTISGNAATATALAADPTDCSAGQATVGVNASGAAQGCFTPAGTGANTALSNLASVAINTALLPDAAAADDFGSATLPWKDVFFAGSSLTPGTNNFKITGTSTGGTRTITFGDGNSSVSGTNTGDQTNISGNAATVTTNANLTGPVTSVGNATAITDGAVVLADMANLAQDQFIGRVTASTGVPETATITAAARTVLDDTTVSAMVDTLGGASATGTGGLARAISPAFTTPNIGSATGSISGNAGTATALAANGANCAAGNYPLGVDASGAVEDCTAVGAGSETQATVLTKVSLRF